MDKQHFAIDRKHARIETTIPCRIGLPGDARHEAQIVNLSIGGLKLACNHETYLSIIPEEQRTPGQVADVLVAIRFSLRPISRRAMNMDLAARLIHTERLAQDSYHVGIQFTGMSKSDFNRLESFIEEQVSPGDPDSAGQ